MLKFETRGQAIKYLKCNGSYYASLHDVVKCEDYYVLVMKPGRHRPERWPAQDEEGPKHE